jgi:hypothetical protein
MALITVSLFILAPPVPVFAAEKAKTINGLQEIKEFLLEDIEEEFDSKIVEDLRKPQSTTQTPKERAPLKPANIPPLYSEPKMEGEGVWKRLDLIEGPDNEPALYTTFYRPSERFPTAIVYMLLMEMKGIVMDLRLGSAEPLRKDGAPAMIEESRQRDLLAVTNALWQSRHTRGSGIIYNGELLREMAPGKATIVIYKDGSVDILEWNDQIPIPSVKHARQLKHLMVEDGKVITLRKRHGKTVPAEIGLGSLLNEEQPVIKIPPKKKGKKPRYKLNITSGDLWFIATRSAFGIRPDGNLVFGVGHHIGTIDLAKALALAGCVRVMHGDANPGNSVGVLYHRNKEGRLVELQRLSPLQHKSTVHRYLKRSYPKDFFAYFRKIRADNSARK